MYICIYKYETLNLSFSTLYEDHEQTIPGHTSFIRAGNHTHAHTYMCVQKESENHLILRKKCNVYTNSNKINNH